MMSPYSKSVLVGYTSQQAAYEVDNYPWGFRLKTKKYYWIESKKGAGDRLGSYTIDPKTGRACKPKYSTYNTFMYLYIDSETGYIEHGAIDSYKHDEFQARFEFILNKIGVEYLSDVQKENIRINHLQHTKMNAAYQAARYSDEKKPEFIQWAKNTLKHIYTCDFKDLVDYPEKPVEDKPDGEIKMTITEYVTK